MGVGRNFSRGATSGFFQTFYKGEPKVVKFGFQHSKLRKTTFFAETFKLLPLFRHPCLCVRKVRATPLKIWGNFKCFNTILNRVICWILYAKWNIWQINSNRAFVFALERLNSYILFLHWQHNWHPYGQLASCYICFVLPLYSGI